MLPCAIARAEERAADSIWQQLRDGGRAIAEDLRQRARPRWQPQQRPVSSEAETRWPELPGELDPSLAQRWRPPDVDPPRFSRILVQEGGAVAIEGLGTPGSAVELRSGGRVVGTTVVDDGGSWRAALERRLQPGVHRIESSVRETGRTEIVAGSDVRLAIPEGWSGTLSVTYNAEAARLSDAATRARAEAIAREATERFSQIITQPGSTESERVPQQGQPERREESANAVVRWLERSARGYQGAVVPELAQPDRTAAANFSDREAAPRETGQPASLGENAMALREQVNDWLDRSKRAYQRDVASRLSVTTGSPGDDGMAMRSDDDRRAAKAEAKPEGEPAADDARRRKLEQDQRRREEAERRQAEVERARRDKARQEAEAQAEAARRAEIERLKRAEAARVRQEAEQRAAEERRQLEEQRRQAEIDKRLEEAARLEAEARRKAEIAKLDAEAKRIAAEQSRKDKERKRLAAEADLKRAEAERLAKIAEEKERARKSDPILRAEEQKRLAAAAKKEEAKRLAEEAQRKEAERKRLAEESEKLAKDREAERARAEREVAIVRKEEEQSQQDAEAEQLAADHERRVSEAETAPRVVIPRKVRDPRPAEGSAEGEDAEAGVAVRADGASIEQPRRVCRARGRRVKGGRLHVVRPGETLWALARRYYGDGRRYEIIYRANASRISDPDLIVDCQRLFVPMRRRR